MYYKKKRAISAMARPDFQDIINLSERKYLYYELCHLYVNLFAYGNRVDATACLQASCAF